LKKNTYDHYLDDHFNHGQKFNDKLFSTAYGLHGLGLPIHGLRHTVKYLNAHVLQRF